VRKEGKGDRNNNRKHKQKGWEVNYVERRKRQKHEMENGKEWGFKAKN
jgi:hypothetical protein